MTTIAPTNRNAHHKGDSADDDDDDDATSVMT